MISLIQGLLLWRPRRKKKRWIRHFNFSVRWYWILIRVLFCGKGYKVGSRQSAVTVLLRGYKTFDFSKNFVTMQPYILNQLSLSAKLITKCMLSVMPKNQGILASWFKYVFGKNNNSLLVCPWLRRKTRSITQWWQWTFQGRWPLMLLVMSHSLVPQSK